MKPNNPKELTVPDLMTSLTHSFAIGDRFSYQNSKNAKKLELKGRDVIPKIGTYMKNIKNDIEDMGTEEDKEEIKQGWIGFLGHLIDSFKIDIEPYIKANKFIVTYDEWAEWAIQS